MKVVLKFAQDAQSRGAINGYYLNLAANVIMLSVFNTCAVAQIYLGIKFGNY
jgi:hypothetical protein